MKHMANLERNHGTISIGVRAPIIREGDDLVKIVTESVLATGMGLGMKPEDRDVIGITESVVARSQGNYATVDDIAADVKAKFGENTVGVIFPILSRNRFAICLRGIAKGAKKIVLMLQYPDDEVGNKLVSEDKFYDLGHGDTTKLYTEETFRATFGETKHEFTGVDYIEYYKELVTGCGCEAEVIFSNDCVDILKYTDYVLNCDIHTRKITKKRLLAAGAKAVYGMDDILTEPASEGGGYNAKYGLLGSNKATEDKVKLFPNDPTDLVNAIQKEIQTMTGAKVEVMVYGDGAFKDPQGKIWELADPVVSPGFTEGLRGTPSELKLKYLADNDYAHLTGDELKAAIRDRITEKDHDLVGKMVSEGTTPRQLTDLLGSLCDLTSGSGDKGTPIIWIKGYFDNYTTL